MCLVRLNKRRAAELAPVRRHGLGAQLVVSRVRLRIGFTRGICRIETVSSRSEGFPLIQMRSCYLGACSGSALRPHCGHSLDSRWYKMLLPEDQQLFDWSA